MRSLLDNLRMSDTIYPEATASSQHVVIAIISIALMTFLIQVSILLTHKACPLFQITFSCDSVYPQAYDHAVSHKRLL